MQGVHEVFVVFSNSLVQYMRAKKFLLRGSSECSEKLASFSMSVLIILKCIFGYGEYLGVFISSVVSCTKDGCDQ